MKRKDRFRKPLYVEVGKYLRTDIPVKIVKALNTSRYC